MDKHVSQILFLNDLPLYWAGIMNQNQKLKDMYDYYEDEYSGSYAHDVEGYTDEEIDTVFDGDPEAYWNID